MSATLYDEYPIRPLKRTRVPKSIVTLAVVATLSGDRGGYGERWRFGAACFIRQGDARRDRNEACTFDSPATFWRRVTKFCGYQGLTFLWVYDLPQVARLSGVLAHLPELGWTLDAFSLNPGGAWMVWRKGKASLKVCDIMSVWPMTLDRIATLFGYARRSTPRADALPLEWLAVAQRDRLIIHAAMTAYVQWVKEEDLGTLAVTGNGQAWAAFRRRFMTDGILVHNNTDVRTAERRAMWTGRCEAYWHGDVPFSLVHEWDLTSAHTNIVVEEDLPVLLHGPVDPAKGLDHYLDDPAFLLLAEVDVKTDAPAVPTLWGDSIVWPVGTFTTVLWEPELRLARNRCDAVRLRRGWLYRRAPALRTWGRWILQCLDSPDTTVPAWRKAILKRWGNVLVGHFAMQFPQWTRVGWSPIIDVTYAPCRDEESGDEYALMQVGHEIWRQSGVQDAHYCASAITGYVMSCCRVRLWDLMERMPERSLLYVDTDSLLTTEAYLDEMIALQGTWTGRGLRLKRSWSGLTIYGPRQIVTGDSVRVAGLAKRLGRVDRHVYEGEVVEGLLEAIGARRVDEVRLMPRQWRIEGTDTRRAATVTGWTRPFVVNDFSAVID